MQGGVLAGRNEEINAVSLRKRAGLWLRERREYLGLSQRDLARLVNTEYYTFISQIEAGRGRVPADRLMFWAKALDMKPREFAITLMQFYDPYTYEMVFGLTDHVPKDMLNG
jgi:transcriptional regulator with XRE-family HTH domain